MLRQDQQNYAGEVEELCDDVFFVAASPAMRKIRSQAALVANVDIPVLCSAKAGPARKCSVDWFTSFRRAPIGPS